MESNEQGRRIAELVSTSSSKQHESDSLGEASSSCPIVLQLPNTPRLCALFETLSMISANPAGRISSTAITGR